MVREGWAEERRDRRKMRRRCWRGWREGAERRNSSSEEEGEDEAEEEAQTERTSSGKRTVRNPKMVFSPPLPFPFLPPFTDLVYATLQCQFVNRKSFCTQTTFFNVPVLGPKCPTRPIAIRERQNAQLSAVENIGGN